MPMCTFFQEHFQIIYYLKYIWCHFTEDYYYYGKDKQYPLSAANFPSFELVLCLECLCTHMANCSNLKLATQYHP